MKQDNTLFFLTLKENLIKNAIIVIVMVIFYATIKNNLSSLEVEEIKDFLLMLSVLLVTACAANFTFSYEHTIIESGGMRFLSHASTFVLMLLIALLLEAIVLSVSIIYPSVYSVIFWSGILLYLGIILYDFWDLFRAFKIRDVEIKEKE